MNLLIAILLMLNPTVITSKLAGLVGFRQPFNPAYQKLDADNQTSRSGLYMTDNPFVKMEFITDTQDYKDIADCDLNTYLRRRVADAAIYVGNAVFGESDFIDRQVLYLYPNNKVSALDLPAGFVGYRISQSSKKDLAISIKRILCEFQGTGSITLVLFNSAKSAAVNSTTVNIIGGFQEVETNWVADNTGGPYKGDFYIGYFTSGVTLKPYARNYESGSVMADVSELCIERVTYPSAVGPNFFNLESPGNALECNGLNPDITVYRDWTDLMVQNEKLFAHAIQLQCQISFLTEYLASIRSNRNERLSNEMVSQVMMEIEGNSGDGSVKVTGLRPRLLGSIKRIQNEIKKLQDGYTDSRHIMVESSL